MNYETQKSDFRGLQPLIPKVSEQNQSEAGDIFKNWSWSRGVEPIWLQVQLRMSGSYDFFRIYAFFWAKLPRLSVEYSNRCRETAKTRSHLSSSHSPFIKMFLRYSNFYNSACQVQSHQLPTK